MDENFNSMNKVLIIFAFCSSIFGVFDGEATTYYFSSSHGSDDYSPIQAQDSKSPWKTLKKANQIFKDLSPGDSLLFKAGDTFSGSLKMVKSGTEDYPIYIGAYGQGKSPILTGFQKIDKWTSAGEGIYKAQIVKNTSRLNLVVKNGEIQPLGRFPNSNDSKQGYITLDLPSKNNQISNPALNKGIKWTGAEIVIRKNQWIIDRETIISHQGDTISFIPSSSYIPKEKFGFFIQNHLETLDRNGEWYYDQDEMEIFMYFGEEDPHASEILFSLEDQLISSLTNTRNIILEGLKMEGANKHVILLLGGDNIQILSCQISYAGIDALWVKNVSNFRIEHSQIKHSLNCGIHLRPNNDYSIIRNNTIDSTYLFPGMGQSGDGNGYSIITTSDDGIVERNQIFNSGYVGIRFGGSRTVVSENLIDGFCLTKNDGGGIYTYTGNSSKTFTDRVVRNNIVLNGIGNPNGTPIRNRSQTVPAEGIYLDDNASNIQVKGNTVAHIKGRGIYVHNARNISIKDNLVFDAAYCIYLSSDDLGQDVTGLNVEFNQFTAYTPEQFTVGIDVPLENLPSIGIWGKNKHQSPFGNEFLINLRMKSDNLPDNVGIISYTKWVDYWNIEKQSTFLTSLHPYYRIQNYQSTNLFKNMGFDNDTKGISGKNISWESTGLFSSGHVYVNQKETNTHSAKINIGPLSKDKKYLVEFESRSSKPTNHLVHLRYSGAPYATVSPRIKTKVDSTIGVNKMIFEVFEDVLEGSLIIESVGKDFSYALDNLVVREAKVEKIDPSGYFNFVYNYNAEPLNLTKEYLKLNQIKNSSMEGQVIAPYSSVLDF